MVMVWWSYGKRLDIGKSSGYDLVTMMALAWLGKHVDTLLETSIAPENMVPQKQRIILDIFGINLVLD